MTFSSSLSVVKAAPNGTGSGTPFGSNSDKDYFSENEADISGGVFTLEMDVYRPNGSGHFIDPADPDSEFIPYMAKINVYRHDGTDYELIYQMDKIFMVNYYIGEGDYLITLATNDDTIFPKNLSNPWYNSNTNEDYQNLSDEKDYALNLVIGADGKVVSSDISHFKMGNPHSSTINVGSSSWCLEYKLSANSNFRIIKTDDIGNPLEGIIFHIEGYNMWADWSIAGDIDTADSEYFSDTRNDLETVSYVSTGIDGYTEFIYLPLYSHFYRVTEINPPQGARAIVFYVETSSDGSIYLSKPNPSEEYGLPGIPYVPLLNPSRPSSGAAVKIHSVEIQTIQTTLQVINTFTTDDNTLPTENPTPQITEEPIPPQPVIASPSPSPSQTATASPSPSQTATASPSPSQTVAPSIPPSETTETATENVTSLPPEREAPQTTEPTNRIVVETPPEGTPPNIVITYDDELDEYSIFEDGTPMGTFSLPPGKHLTDFNFKEIRELIVPYGGFHLKVNPNTGDNVSVLILAISLSALGIILQIKGKRKTENANA